jgi:YD repeat-containing protein
LFAIGCTTSSSSHKLPSASFTPHPDLNTEAVACGEDVALDGHTTPDLRYAFTFDASGALVHATGTYAAGGPDNVIDYTYNATGEMTHMLAVHGWNDTQSEITAHYDDTGSMLDYTSGWAQGGMQDAWTYTMSNFFAPWQPSREVIAEAGSTSSLGYTLAYDSDGRLVLATPDSGPPTTWTYDDTTRTVSADTGSGAFTEVTVYDDQYRLLSDTWGGSDPNATSGSDVYAWQGDHLGSWTYASGMFQEIGTMRYDCSTARAVRPLRVRTTPSHIGALR